LYLINPTNEQGKWSLAGLSGLKQKRMLSYLPILFRKQRSPVELIRNKAGRSGRSTALNGQPDDGFQPSQFALVEPDITPMTSGDIA
jgi:hypothetical protein